MKWKETIWFKFFLLFLGAFILQAVVLELLDEVRGWSTAHQIDPSDTLMWPALMAAFILTLEEVVRWRQKG